MLHRSRRRSSHSRRTPPRKIRYAVVGLGYISQAAVLPAFAHARRNSVLAALVSDDSQKLDKLGRKYKVARRYSYDRYEECLRSGEIDAVFIALPNSMHHRYTVRAAAAGVHVLCEKPMAVTEEECEAMIHACDDAHVRLMIAYRLHFEETTLRAIEIARKGKLGELRIFDSTFTMQVRDEDNIRLKAAYGGGPLYDIGIYCINAARCLFRDEPREVFAFSANKGDQRFSEVDEMTTAVLRYPGERLGSFTCSFGAADVSSYRIIGTRGDLRVEPAYEYAEGLGYRLTVNGRSRERSFRKRDQFAAELLYFSDCVLQDRRPEPSGEEGLADVRIIRALLRSAQTCCPVRLEGYPLDGVSEERHPTPAQVIKRPGVRKPKLVHAESPSGRS